MMESNDTKNTPIISILSGKGGTGKTTVALGMTTLLNQVGYRVLLIDGDLITNGLSHYFENEISNNAQVVSLSDYLCIDNQSELESSSINDTFPTVIVSKEGFGFIPSTSDLDRPISNVDAILDGEAGNFRFKTLIEQMVNVYDIIIIDNPTGSNTISELTTKHSNKAIIVSELDKSSSDGARILIQDLLGILPGYTRHLINKLDHRERTNYTDISDSVFSESNRLPPLPLDSRVETTSTPRIRPFDREIVTAFYLALFNTLSAIFPESRDKFEDFKINDESYRNMYYNRIYGYVDDVIITDEVGRDHPIGGVRTEVSAPTSLLYASLVYALIGGGVYLLHWYFFSESTICRVITYIVIIFTCFIIALSMWAHFYYKKRLETIRVNIEQTPQISQELDNYKSLLLTQDEEFLCQFEKIIVKPTDANPSVK